MRSKPHSCIHQIEFESDIPYNESKHETFAGVLTTDKFIKPSELPGLQGKDIGVVERLHHDFYTFFRKCLLVCTRLGLNTY
jgi:hypothetical protein